MGDNLFVHGGLRREHLRVIDTQGGGAGDGTVASAEEVMEDINAGVCAWMLGGQEEVPRIIWGEESPLWTRLYSSPDSRDIGETARAELEEVGAINHLYRDMI